MPMLPKNSMRSQVAGNVNNANATAKTSNAFRKSAIAYPFGFRDTWKTLPECPNPHRHARQSRHRVRVTISRPYPLHISVPMPDHVNAVADCQWRLLAALWLLCLHDVEDVALGIGAGVPHEVLPLVPFLYTATERADTLESRIEIIHDEVQVHPVLASPLFGYLLKPDRDLPIRGVGEEPEMLDSVELDVEQLPPESGHALEIRTVNRGRDHHRCID